MDLYLQSQQPPHATAAQILQEFGPAFKEHPHFYQLGFIIAAAEANLGQFEQFFAVFYPSYQACPEHFLAYKTKSDPPYQIIRKEPAGEEKERQRALISANLSMAASVNPQDLSLYKMKVAFASDHDKAKVIEDSLNKILNGNMIIPRLDVIYYVQQAIGAKEYTLAQSLIDRAKEWYPHSRSIDAAQELLNQNKI